MVKNMIKGKINRKVIYIIWSVLTLLLFTYFISNFNSTTIYLFYGGNSKISISGNITFSKKINILNVDNIRYDGNDINIKKIDISLVNMNKGKETMIFKKGQNSDDLFSFKNYLSTFSYNYYEQYGYDDSLTNDIKNNFYNDTKLKITIVDENNVSKKYEIKIKGEKYSNNELLYKKVEKIG